MAVGRMAAFMPNLQVDCDRVDFLIKYDKINSNADALNQVECNVLVRTESRESLVVHTDDIETVHSGIENPSILSRKNFYL